MQLGLPQELAGRAIAQRAVWAIIVVIDSPRLDLAASVGQREEYIGVEAFVAQTSIKGLDVAVVDGLPRSDEVELDTVLECPCVEHLGLELGAVIDLHDLRVPETLDGTLERSHHLGAI